MTDSITIENDLIHDPIRLQVVWSQLIAAADEAATVLVRTSFSPITRESNDFACVIFDARGNAIAENTIGIPSFNVTLGKTLQHLLLQYPLETWQAGDVAITNDPWLASGHLPDVTVIAPVFHEDKIIAWTGEIAHMADIGGNLWSVDNRQVFEEGLCLPLLKLIQDNAVDENILRILRANVRLPDQVEGDIMALVNAGEVAARRIREIVTEQNIEDFETFSDEICSRAETSMRNAIRELPDGEYKSSIELDGTDEAAVTIAVSINVQNDEMWIDYCGTSDEIQASLNVVFNYTEAYSYFPLKCVLDPGVPRNEGSYRPIHVSAPEGSILNPRRPAPVNARQLVGHTLSTVIYKALAEAVPNRVLAESGSAPTLRVLVSGTTDDNRAFTSILFINGGMGASLEADGLSATCFPSNVVCGAMEVIEATAPLRIWKKELREDSGGPGRTRGGLGQIVELELLSKKQAVLSMFVEHARHAPAGLAGGGAGGVSVVERNGIGHGFPLKGRSLLEPGDRIKVCYPGGGGFGNPNERDPNLITADIREGYVSINKAKEVYGIL